MASSSPLTPLSPNTHKLPQPSRFSRPDSPSRLPQKTTAPRSPSKLKQPQSPLLNFSPTIASIKASRNNSPTKMSDIENESFHTGLGDDSMCSNFTDFTVGQYGTASEGLDKLLQDAPCSPKRSPVKSRPQTPTMKRPKSTATTPRTVRPMSRSAPQADGASPSSSPSPTPMRSKADQTTNLLDFTQQFEAIARPNFQKTSTHRRAKSASPTKGSPTKTALPPTTPTESRFFNLLDFSPGPAVTPGSVPTHTPRELEEIRATHNSEVSLMKAQLNGREVEVSGLRSAIEESEKRCADLSHSVKAQANTFEAERQQWKKVQAEMSELFEVEKAEKESISGILAEKEKVVENLHAELEKEGKDIQNLRKRLRDAEDDAGRSREEVIRVKEEAALNPAAGTGTSSDTQAEVERVARELHALYKAKHENKVAALKKSYESRWEKKVAALQEVVASLSKKNEELARELEERKAEELTADMSFSAADPNAAAEIKKLRMELESERQEKEGIVSLVEELLAIQATEPPEQVEAKMRGSVRRASGVHGFRTASGLRSGIEKMGMGAARNRGDMYGHNGAS